MNLSHILTDLPASAHAVPANTPAGSDPSAEYKGLDTAEVKANFAGVMAQLGERSAAAGEINVQPVIRGTSDNVTTFPQDDPPALLPDQDGPTVPLAKDKVAVSAQGGDDMEATDIRSFVLPRTAHALTPETAPNGPDDQAIVSTQQARGHVSANLADGRLDWGPSFVGQVPALGKPINHKSAGVPGSQETTLEPDRISPVPTTLVAGQAAIQPARTERATQGQSAALSASGAATIPSGQPGSGSAHPPLRQASREGETLPTPPALPVRTPRKPSALPTPTAGLTTATIAKSSKEVGGAEASFTLSMTTDPQATTPLRSDFQTHSQVTSPPQFLARAEALPPPVRMMAEVLQQAPQRPVEITLSPEELGRVRLHLTTAEATIIVSVLAERSETTDLMRRHISELQSAMHDIGYTDVTFEFGSGEHADNAADESPGTTTELSPADQMAAQDLPLHIALKADSRMSVDLRL